MNERPWFTNRAVTELALERHGDQLGLDAHLDDQVGRHQVDPVPVTTADEVEPRRERPRHAAAMAIELLVR